MLRQAVAGAVFSFGILWSGVAADPVVAQGAGSRPRAAAACPSGLECGAYGIAGLGARKQQILGAGANPLELAVAMLETDTLSASYPYGDRKTKDAANFGIFKQNWLMLRKGCGAFRGQSVGQWNNGSALNSDLAADVACIRQSRNHYGSKWFAGQRNGQSGLDNPDTGDIRGYKAAVVWIRDQLTNNPGGLSSDTRWWVKVRPI